jgi:hypothetical protein
MVNQELIDLCRLVVAAIQDTDSFDSRQLRKLMLHIVPQLLAEIDILAAVAASASERAVEPVAEAKEEVPPAAVEPPAPAPTRRPSRKKKGKKRARSSS